MVEGKGETCGCGYQKNCAAMVTPNRMYRNRSVQRVRNLVIIYSFFVICILFFLLAFDPRLSR